MKLPWLSREIVDLLMQEISRLHDQIDTQKAEYHALLDKYHAMKVSATPSTVSVAPRDIDLVTQAIIAKSKNNPILYQHFGTFVATQRAQQVEEAVIADQILHGVPDDQGVPL